MSFVTRALLSGLALVSVGSAIPAPAPVLNGLLGAGVLDNGTAKGLIGSLLDQLQVDTTLTNIDLLDQLVQTLNAVQPGLAPTSAEEALTRLSQIFTSQPPNPAAFIQNIADVIAAGISVGDLTTIFTLYSSGINNPNNNNPDPPRPVYPSPSTDAPFSKSEAELRGTIYIPETFTYGRIPPVILVPGTGSTGGVNFASNVLKIIQSAETPYADPVWLNIPPLLLNDAQSNAEHVAYAINYISAVTGRPTRLVTWSQGGLITQWAFKYFPSTIANTRNLVAFSPDFHGTVLANVICPGFPRLPCSQAVLQQQYDSKFIAALRSDGGDSAYVPTTTIYSATDQIVQPMSGSSASARLNDARGVGVTNAEVQVVCKRLPAGGVYLHEGTLYNPLGIALMEDALINGFEADLGRVDLGTVCSQVLAEGLGVGDLVSTEGVIVIVTAAILLGGDRVLEEPVLRGYAA